MIIIFIHYGMATWRRHFCYFALMIKFLLFYCLNLPFKEM